MAIGRKLIPLMIAVSAFASSVNAQISPIPYEVIHIGASTGTPFSAGISLSNTGFVAGAGSTGAFQQAFIWRQDMGIQWLSHPFGVGSSFPSAVNDAGQVIGTSFEPSRGVLWNADGSVAHVFQEPPIASPSDLNNAAVVTGRRSTPSGQSAFIWSSGSYTDLGFPPPAITSQGRAINDLGQVAGVLNGGQAHGAFASAPAAFLWSQASGFTTIITSQIFAAIDVTDLSEQGTLVGTGQWNGGLNIVGWRWSSGTGFSLLSTLPGEPRSRVRAVNDSGLIVGSSGVFGTIWDQDGNIYKADDLLAADFFGWRITALWGINSDGWLTGEALRPGSANSQAVLLGPIPEPAVSGTILLMTASLLPRRRTHR